MGGQLAEPSSPFLVFDQVLGETVILGETVMKEDGDDSRWPGPAAAGARRVAEDVDGNCWGGAPPPASWVTTRTERGAVPTLAAAQHQNAFGKKRAGYFSL